MNTTEILDICSKIKGDKALATNKGSKELLENFYQSVCDQGSCNHQEDDSGLEKDGHDMILSCCGERVVGGYSNCETIVLENADQKKFAIQMSNLKTLGWTLIPFRDTLVYTKNPEITNALQNPKKVEIQVEKPSEDAIIDRETKPGVAQVGTTPDPQLLFPEEDKEKETEYKSMETKW